MNHFEVIDEDEGSYYDNYEFLYVRGINSRGTKPLEDLAVEMTYWITEPLSDSEIQKLYKEFTTLVIDQRCIYMQMGKSTGRSQQRFNRCRRQRE